MDPKISFFKNQILPFFMKKFFLKMRRLWSRRLKEKSIVVAFLAGSLTTARKLLLKLCWELLKEWVKREVFSK